MSFLSLDATGDQIVEGRLLWGVVIAAACPILTIRVAIAGGKAYLAEFTLRVDGCKVPKSDLCSDRDGSLGNMAFCYLRRFTSSKSRITAKLMNNKNSIRIRPPSTSIQYSLQTPDPIPN
jgi:hypothetical protein